MFLNFIGLTLFFGIGILLANGISFMVTKGKNVKRMIVLLVIELLLLGSFLFDSVKYFV
ncbi:hypothetical protein [Enterococcus rotai]|uniref:hypothetical protein n=1 Tax=Enterococcus rotai TaxID=118060 RepID=UPI0035C76449